MTFTYYHKFQGLYKGQPVTIPDQITKDEFQKLTEFPVVTAEGKKIIVKMEQVNEK